MKESGSLRSWRRRELDHGMAGKSLRRPGEQRPPTPPEEADWCTLDVHCPLALGPSENLLFSLEAISSKQKGKRRKAVREVLRRAESVKDNLGATPRFISIEARAANCKVSANPLSASSCRFNQGCNSPFVVSTAATCQDRPSRVRHRTTLEAGKLLRRHHTGASARSYAHLLATPRHIGQRLLEHRRRHTEIEPT